MLKLYYRIWVDAIAAAKSSGAGEKNWWIVTIIPISVLQGINLFTIFYWMKIIVNRNLPLFVGFDIFDYLALNSFIGILLTYFVPFVLLNYLLIFINDKYVPLMAEYKAEGGKLYKRYVMATLGVAVIPVIIKTMFF